MTNYLAHASALAAGACALMTAAVLHHIRRQGTVTHQAMAKARRDAAFVEWARRTFISITDHEGALFHRSLADLQDCPDDMIWGEPRSVILFYAGPDEPDPYGIEEDSSRG